MPSGIVWVGPISGRTGYAAVSRNYIKGLTQLGVKVRILSPESQITGRNIETNTNMEELHHADVGQDPVVVIHSTPEFFGKIYARGVSKRVGCTIFETDRIPAKWVKYCNRMDMIWVPSKFNYETFSVSGVQPSKLRVVPYCIDTSLFKPRVSQMAIPGKRRFSFLYIFGVTWRKGFDLLLESYYREFTSADDVSLILRAYDETGRGSETLHKIIFDSVADKIDLGRKDLPHVTFVDKSLDQQELLDLYAACDLYISTDRANGWGMPCMEAMAMGKPAATINWSGSTEFMNEGNSLLIHPTGRFVPVDRRLAVDTIYSGHHWAEVTVGEVRNVMRFAYENPIRLREIAQRGMEDIRERYSIMTGAQRIVQELRLNLGEANSRKSRYGRLLWDERLAVVKVKRSSAVASKVRKHIRYFFKKISQSATSKGRPDAS